VRTGRGQKRSTRLSPSQTCSSVAGNEGVESTKRSRGERKNCQGNRQLEEARKWKKKVGPGTREFKMKAVTLHLWIESSVSRRTEGKRRRNDPRSPLSTGVKIKKKGGVVIPRANNKTGKRKEIYAKKTFSGPYNVCGEMGLMTRGGKGVGRRTRAGGS